MSDGQQVASIISFPLFFGVTSSIFSEFFFLLLLNLWADYLLFFSPLTHLYWKFSYTECCLAWLSPRQQPHCLSRIWVQDPRQP
jgi:hypothetical protein